MTCLSDVTVLCGKSTPATTPAPAPPPPRPANATPRRRQADARRARRRPPARPCREPTMPPAPARRRIRQGADAMPAADATTRRRRGARRVRPIHNTVGGLVATCVATPGDDGRRLRRLSRRDARGRSFGRTRRRPGAPSMHPHRRAAAGSRRRAFRTPSLLVVADCVAARQRGGALRVSLDRGQEEVRTSVDQPGGEKSLFSLLFSANRLASPCSG